MKDNIEEIRQQFESWYINQKLDQIATWHSVETLRSVKQNSWIVWQAAYLTALKETNLITI